MQARALTDRGDRRLSESQARQLRILIVEDEAIGAMYLQQTVEVMGHRVIGVVDNGESAIKVSLGERPDLVLMDIRIRGDIDGVIAAYSIKASTAIPSILISAYGENEIRQYRNVREDFVFLRKPVPEEELRRAIEGLFLPAVAEPASAQPV